MPGSHSKTKQQEQTKFQKIVNKTVTRVIANYAFYPVQVIRTLVQLGYEPVPPKVVTSFCFRTKYLVYPGFIGYTKYIYRNHGLLALYSGGFHFVTSQISYMLVGELLRPSVDRLLDSVAEKCGVHLPEQKTSENAEYEFVRSVKLAVKKCVASSITDIIATTLSHPFRLVALRVITQIIGGETAYAGYFSPYWVVVSDEGSSGLFTGLAPLILARVLNNVIRESLFVILEFLISLVPKHPYQTFASPLVPHVASYCGTLSMYPLILTSNLLAIRPAPLKGAQESILVPSTSNWRRTFGGLRSRAQLFHGTTVISFSRTVPKWSPDYRRV